MIGQESLVCIVPLKLIEYGFGYVLIRSNTIPLYPIFYLLKGDVDV